MAQEFAKAFYRSKQWQHCRNEYAKSVGNLCEICLSNGQYVPGEIVHHKVHINPDNIDNPLVTLNWDNLQLVCRQCHANIHEGKRNRRYYVDKNGNVIIID